MTTHWINLRGIKFNLSKTICSLYVHHMFTVYPQYVHYMFIVCSLYVHYIFIICLLYVQYMFTTCSLYLEYVCVCRFSCIHIVSEFIMSWIIVFFGDFSGDTSPIIRQSVKEKFFARRAMVDQAHECLRYHGKVWRWKRNFRRRAMVDQAHECLRYQRKILNILEVLNIEKLTRSVFWLFQIVNWVICFL